MNAIALGASAFGAGIVSSVGPCAAPRLFALALLGPEKNHWAYAGVFIAGSAASYAAAGAAGSSLVPAIASPLLYWLLAGACAFGAARALFTPAEKPCCRPDDRRTLGTAFVAGFAGALTSAGCCAPVALVLAQVSASNGAAFAAGILTCFAFGQGLPMLALAAGSQKLSGLLENSVATHATATVSGGVLLALAGYYAVLA